MNAESATPATTQVGKRRLDPDRLVRWSTILVVVLVALAAAYVSYGHAFDLIHSHGESRTAAVVGSGTVDGLVYASEMVLLQAARYRQPAPWLAHFGLWLGIAATGGANVAHGISHGYVGALVSVWPAVALITSYALLMKMIRTGAAKGVESGTDQDATVGDACPHGVAATAREAVVNAWLHERDCLGEPPVQRQFAARFEISDRKKLKRWLDEDDPAAPTNAGGALEVPAEPPTEVAAPALNGQGPA